MYTYVVVELQKKEEIMGSLATVNDSLFKWVKNKLKRIDVIKDSKLYLISLKIILNAKKNILRLQQCIFNILVNSNT